MSSLLQPVLQPDQYIQQLSENLNFYRYHRPTDASVLLAITQEKNPKILLTRRSSQLRSHAGEVSFPGGKWEKGDTSNIAVALREAQEETALNPFDVQLLGELPTERSKAGLFVKPIVGLIPAQSPLIAEPSEIERIFYLPLYDFVQCPAEVYTANFAGQRLHFPSMTYDNEVVWGLTARILISLLKEGLGYRKNWPFFMKSPEHQ